MHSANFFCRCMPKVIPNCSSRGRGSSSRAWGVMQRGRGWGRGGWAGWWLGWLVVIGSGRDLNLIPLQPVAA